MKFEFCHETKLKFSFRETFVKTSYDLKEDTFIQRFSGDINIENKSWNVGLIVGSSGSGKSSILKNTFGVPNKIEWGNDSIINNFDEKLSCEEIISYLSMVGFSVPPYWLKSYHVLSNGEKMRVDLARILSHKNEIAIFDEFTSVVDRDVAKITSISIQKLIRKKHMKFVAISCHRDIIDWLNPDWIYDTDKKEFFFVKNDQILKLKLKSDNVINLCGPVLKTIII